MSNAASGYRQYFTPGNWRLSNWISLQKDDYYFIEALHQQLWGQDHMTVSVEISDPDIVPGHQQSMREIQRLLVTQANVRDKWTLEINNPDGGTY